MSYFPNRIKEAVLQIHTAYLGKVLSISGNTARIQPLTKYKALQGQSKEQSTTTAIIPPNIKFKTEEITYLVSETSSRTKTVVVPASLAVGDIVYVGVCDRDITYAKKGVISEATHRHHDINDGVILRVLG